MLHGNRRKLLSFIANSDFCYEMARKRTDSNESSAAIMAKAALQITVPSNVPLDKEDIVFITK